MSFLSFGKLFATIVDIARRLSKEPDEWRRALFAVAAVAAPRLISAQSLQATLNSTPKVNNRSPDSERYNTRSYGEEGSFHSLKSRAVDPRDETDRATKWREHVEVEEGCKVAGAEDASLLTGCPSEGRPAGVRGPEPCDQAYEACSERQQYGELNMDDLARRTPTDPSPAPEDDFRGQFENSYDTEAEDELLCWLQADRRSIVLHSPNPSETPHIVITPPSTLGSSGDYPELDGIWENRLPVQWIGWHVVPPSPSQWAVYVPPSPWGHEGGWWYGGGYAPPPPPPPPLSDTTAPVSCATEEQPWPIDPLDFKRLVALASQDHLARYQAVLPFYHHQYKAAAYAASAAAVEFRERWDSEDIIQVIENPFVWQDPAAPLLSYYGRNRGIPTLIIESTEPFLAPHIIIEDAPPQQSWELDFHKIPYQDFNSLVVPGTRREAIDDLPEYYDGLPEGSALLVDVPFETEEYDVGTDSDATLDSVELESPRDAVFRYTDYPVDLDGDEDADFDGDVTMSKTSSPAYVYDPMEYEDEEDELPSLDDEFYRSTAQRHGIDLHLPTN